MNLSLIGPSGSGKSSILRLILLEERPDSGDIYLLGSHIKNIPKNRICLFRRKIGMVFQDFRLLSTKTVAENIAYAQRVIGKSKAHIRIAIPEVLRIVRLEDKADRRIHELSGGEQQRVAIARAIVNKPSILLADEPTGNLDPETSSEIMSVLRSINANGTAVVMATHDVGIVNTEKKRVIQMKYGTIMRDESRASYGQISPHSIRDAFNPSRIPNFPSEEEHSK